MARHQRFTLTNVRPCGQRHRPLRGRAENPPAPASAVGHRPALLGETFCSCGDILTAHITPLVIAEVAPTPAIAYAASPANMRMQTINFTASHNPQITGIKFSTPGSAPAYGNMPNEQAQSTAAKRQPLPLQARPATSTLDPRATYLARLREIADFDIHASTISVVTTNPPWEPPAAIPTRLYARLESKTGPSTTIATSFSAAMPPSPMTISSKTFAKRCVPSKRTSASPPTATPTRFGVSAHEDGTFFQPNYIAPVVPRLSRPKPGMEKWRGKICGHDQPDQCRCPAPQS